MIAIKEMDIPNRCAKCKFCLRQGTNNYGSFGKCLLQKNKRVNCLAWNRDDDCPLIEIVTCKNCKYWDKEDGYCKLSSHINGRIDYVLYTNTDFFCKNGKRRE